MSSLGPCGSHKVEACSCGNVLYQCDCADTGSKIRVNMRICRCENPGPMRGVQRHQQYSRSTLYGSVKKTWQDLECDQIADEKYSTAIRTYRHQKRMKQLGAKRIIYE